VEAAGQNHARQHLHAGGRDLDPRAIVGEGRGHVADLGGRHAEHALDAGRIVREGAVAVAGGCNHYRAVIEGIAHDVQLISGLRLAAPRAIDDARAAATGVVHAFEGIGNVAALTRAHPHDAAIGSESGDALPVVAGRRRDAGHVRAVGLRRFERRGRGIPVEIHEIVAASVIHKTVAVVVHPRHAMHFRVISPLGVRELRVREVHAHVHYGYDDRRIAARNVPGGFGLNSGQSPLMSIERVIGRSVEGLPLAQAVGRPVGPAHGAGLDIFHPRIGTQRTEYPRHVFRAGRGDDRDALQSCSGASGFGQRAANGFHMNSGVSQKIARIEMRGQGAPLDDQLARSPFTETVWCGLQSGD